MSIKINKVKTRAVVSFVSFYSDYEHISHQMSYIIDYDNHMNSLYAHKACMGGIPDKLERNNLSSWEFENGLLPFFASSLHYINVFLWIELDLIKKILTRKHELSTIVAIS